jgi:hypothetical protein
MDSKNDQKILTISFPRYTLPLGDSILDSIIFSYCDDGVMLKAYVNSIGKIVDYGGIKRKVLSVKITETHFCVKFELEGNNE